MFVPLAGASTPPTCRSSRATSARPHCASSSLPCHGARFPWQFPSWGACCGGSSGSYPGLGGWP